jgi:hypothetical protein
VRIAGTRTIWPKPAGAAADKPSASAAVAHNVPERRKVLGTIDLQVMGGPGLGDIQMSLSPANLKVLKKFSGIPEKR